jgi:hypothetical protein
LPDGWFDAEIVYPDNPAAWVTDQQAAIEVDYAKALEIARRPLMSSAYWAERERAAAAHADSWRNGSRRYTVKVADREVLTASGVVVPDGWTIIKRYLAERAP